MQPVEELRYLILAAQREAYRQLADRLRPLGLTPSQAEVLTVLAQREPLSLVDLGELLVCETGSPSPRTSRPKAMAGAEAPPPRHRPSVSLTTRLLSK